MNVKRQTATLFTVALIVGLSPVAGCSSQTLPDRLVERIRAGAARIVLPGDSVALHLVGTPTLPLVDVKVNGTGPYQFLIDLGSNVTVLRRNVVDASRSVVVVERATSDIVHIDTMELGDARLEDITAASYDQLDVDGVLGYNVLQYSSFTLDFPGKRLILHREPLPAPDDRTVFSYQLVDRLPYITVQLGQDSLLVNLDTGASEWMTVPTSWQSRLRWVAAPVPGRTTLNNRNRPVNHIPSIPAGPGAGRGQAVSFSAFQA